MKKMNVKYIVRIALAIVTIALTTASCSKETANPGAANNNPGNGTNTGTNNGGNTETHIVDSKLVGTWMWTESADGAYYDANGTYEGPAYGLALEYKINADGTGTCYNHIYSTIGVGTNLAVDISSSGFFESDTAQHFGYFPLSGTYQSSSGTNRALAGNNELWDTKTNTGKSFLYQKLEFKTINGRDCFEVTSSDGITDRYWKVQ